jgi:transcriptional regulator with XRE-family HTH domain
VAKPHLAEARRLAGLTQRQLAARAGLNRVQLAKYESGTQSPSVTTAARIAHVLGNSVEELFEGDAYGAHTRAGDAARIERLEARLSVLEARFAAVQAPHTEADSRVRPRGRDPRR